MECSNDPTPSVGIIGDVGGTGRGRGGVHEGPWSSSWRRYQGATVVGFPHATTECYYSARKRRVRSWDFFPALAFG